MSLSSLRSNLRYYNSQVTYWRGSADEYSKQMGTYQGELDDRNEQMKLAQAAKGKCSDMTEPNNNIKDDLEKLGNAAKSAVDIDDCLSAAKKIADPNEGNIQAAVGACDALISKLQGEIDDFTEKLNNAIEGQDFSNARADTYHGYADSTARAIVNYKED